MIRRGFWHVVDLVTTSWGIREYLNVIENPRIAKQRERSLMFQYKITADKKIIISNGTVLQTFDVSKFSQIDGLALDEDEIKVAISGILLNGESVLEIIGLGNSEDGNTIIEGINGKDLVWLSHDHLLINTGKYISRITISTSQIEPIHKFSRVSYAPIHLSISPSKEKLAYLRWKSDSQRICLYNRSTNESEHFKVSCRSYCWLDDRTILYSNLNGIKLLDVENGKISIFLKDAKSLLRFPEFKYRCSELSTIIEGSKETYSVKDVENPLYLNQRIFFQVIASNEQRECYSAILSTDLEKKDIQQHHFQKGRYHENYYADSSNSIFLYSREANDRDFRLLPSPGVPTGALVFYNQDWDWDE